MLLDATLDQLAPKKGENYLDLTAGYGGHARQILRRTTNYTESVLVDRDAFAQGQLHEFLEKGTDLMHTDFLAAANQLVKTLAVELAREEGADPVAVEVTLRLLSREAR